MRELRKPGCAKDIEEPRLRERSVWGSIARRQGAGAADETMAFSVRDGWKLLMRIPTDCLLLLNEYVCIHVASFFTPDF